MKLGEVSKDYLSKIRFPSYQMLHFKANHTSKSHKISIAKETDTGSWISPRDNWQKDCPRHSFLPVSNI